MSKHNIEEDDADLENALVAAESGDWEVALPLIKKKPYLINCMPENDEWAILHHAVKSNNGSVVKQLLEVDNCDALVLTKELPPDPKTRCRPPEYPPSTPKEVAQQLGDRESMISLLDWNVNDVREKRFSSNVTFVTSRHFGKKEYVNNLPYFMKEVVMYKDSLLKLGNSPKTHLLDLLMHITKKEDYQWKTVKEKLYHSMYGIDRNVADELNKAVSRNDLYGQILKFFTSRYHTSNALAHYFSNKVDPTSVDLEHALYDLLLDSILMCWGELPIKDCVTYKGVQDKVDYRGVQDKVEVERGTTIMFTHFLSCSLSRKKAEAVARPSGTLFIIDNSASTIHRPRHVKKFTKFPHERECVYGIGAEFEVIHVEDSGKSKTVYLELKEDDE